MPLTYGLDNVSKSAACMKNPESCYFSYWVLITQQLVLLYDYGGRKINHVIVMS